MLCGSDAVVVVVGMASAGNDAVAAMPHECGVTPGKWGWTICASPTVVQRWELGSLPDMLFPHRLRNMTQAATQEGHRCFRG